MKLSPYKDKIPLKERVVLTIKDAGTLSGFGPRTIAEIVNRGELIARKEGARTVILREDFDAWLKNLPRKPVKEKCDG